MSACIQVDNSQKKQNGFSLAEMAVAMGIGTILMLILMVLLNFAFDFFLSKHSLMDAEQMAADFEISMKSVLAQAQNIQYDVDFAGPGLPQNIGAAPGIIVGAAGVGNSSTTTFDTMANALSDWRAVAVFLRESATGTNVAGGVALPTGLGVPVATGIFFRRPSVGAAGSLSGFIDINYGPVPVAGNANVTPFNGTSSDEIFDRITYFQITKHQHIAGARQSVSSVDVVARFRYFRGSTSGTQLSWCPAGDINGGTAGCATNIAWDDITRSFSVVLRNNLMRRKGDASLDSTAGNVEDRGLGNLYFFRALFPNVF